METDLPVSGVVTALKVKERISVCAKPLTGKSICSSSSGLSNILRFVKSGLV